MLDIKENPDEIIFLSTQEEAGSWSVLNSGDKILSKQTKVSEDVYDMQCWNNTDWSEKVRFDTTSNSDLYECNDHLILIGSQAAVCTDDTCENRHMHSGRILFHMHMCSRIYWRLMREPGAVTHCCIKWTVQTTVVTKQESALTAMLLTVAIMPRRLSLIIIVMV